MLLDAIKLSTACKAFISSHFRNKDARTLRKVMQESAEQEQQLLRILTEFEFVFRLGKSASCMKVASL